MKTRMLIATLLSLTALEASASDTSPFYRNQFVVTEHDACATRAPLAVEVSPFYKNQFVITRAEACAVAATREGAAARRVVTLDAQESTPAPALGDAVRAEPVGG
ncbi:MAG: hypothetical protein ACJ79R_17225 [Anaeromyxobacteraceae bacterium]